MSSSPQITGPSYLRMDYSRADKYVYPEPPKLTFWQKLGRGVGKFMSWAGPIGAAVTAVALPGVGLPLAAGIYGLSRYSQDKVAQSYQKDQIAMANQPMPQNITMPGLFASTPPSAGSITTDFIAPRSFDANISDVIMNRNETEVQMRSGF
ncbi:hypothetical protein K1X76_08335 [bacterium]|nr:hypothetical protein [bacterium]